MQRVLRLLQPGHPRACKVENKLIRVKYARFLQTDQAMLDNDYAIPAIISLVTALLIGGLYLFMSLFRDGEDE